MTRGTRGYDNLVHLVKLNVRGRDFEIFRRHRCEHETMEGGGKLGGLNTSTLFLTELLPGRK